MEASGQGAAGPDPAQLEAVRTLLSDMRVNLDNALAQLGGSSRGESAGAGREISASKLARLTALRNAPGQNVACDEVC
jgi:hypothetical protein